ncbi:MAG: MBL fold metallo-hydrolase [Gemmataceae bacterium]|nr:MBL fold metallo-hydrolase [Gemmataceae bacterium]
MGFQPRFHDKPKVTFLGAAGTVTGSMHLLEWRNFRFLFDCGMEKDRKPGPREAEFPFDPALIDAVFLSHDHSDHCGKLPLLEHLGFRGQIYCTAPSKDFLSLVLRDTVRIQQQEARTRHASSPANQHDAFTLLDRCVTLDYGKTHEVRHDVKLRFHDACHLLGSAVTELELGSEGESFRIVYSGDLGRRSLPFLPVPQPLPPADLLICESTYGGKIHDSPATMAAKLHEVLSDTIRRGGKALIPAFSLGRTQLLLHYLDTWMEEGKIPDLPIYLDSPLAVEIGRVHHRHRGRLAVNWNTFPDRLTVLESWDEAQAASFSPDPCILVASGGMCEGGRIISHLKNHLDDPRTSIILVSFQAPGTLGAKLLEKKPSVFFQGRSWNKWAEVHEIKGFSGHADHDDFLALLGPTKNSTRAIRLVHGEPESARALAKGLTEHGFHNVKPVKKGESFTL